MDTKNINITTLIGIFTLITFFTTFFSKGLDWLWNLIVQKFKKQQESIDLKEDIEKINQNLNKIDIRLSTQLGITNRKLANLSGAIKHMQGYLVSLGYKSYLESNSPIRLTSKAKKLLVEIKANEFIQNNLKKFIISIKQIDPKNAYDIQEECKNILQQWKTNGKLEQFEQYAYEKGVSMELISTLMAIELRDIILNQKEFKKFNTNDIDRIESKNS